MVVLSISEPNTHFISCADYGTVKPTANSSFPLTNASFLKGAFTLAFGQSHEARAGEIGRNGRELGGAQRDISKWEDQEC